MNLSLASKPAYVWRVNSLGMGETLNWIPCWYVIDADSDNNIIIGGSNGGNNTQSGYSYISRKKDAVAFIEGYHWCLNSPESVISFNSYSTTGWENECPYPRKMNTEDQRSFFEEGVTAAKKYLSDGKITSNGTLENAKKIFAKLY